MVENSWKQIQWGSEYWTSEWLEPFENRTGYQMVKPFDNPKLICPVAKWFQYLDVQYLDPHCTCLLDYHKTESALKWLEARPFYLLKKKI
jgi:hypothetical protein